MAGIGHAGVVRVEHAAIAVCAAAVAAVVPLVFLNDEAQAAASDEVAAAPVVTATNGLWQGGWAHGPATTQAGTCRSGVGRTQTDPRRDGASRAVVTADVECTDRTAWYTSVRAAGTRT